MEQKRYKLSSIETDVFLSLTTMFCLPVNITHAAMPHAIAINEIDGYTPAKGAFCFVIRYDCRYQQLIDSVVILVKYIVNNGRSQTKALR